MKKLFFIGFLFIYLVSATELRQFLKLPQLFEHYSEHKKLNCDISFFDFLSIHYYNVQSHGEEDEQDEKLPFKSLAGLPFFTFPCFSSATALSPEPAVLPLFKGEGPGESALCTSFHSIIWQPPKLA